VLWIKILKKSEFYDDFEDPAEDPAGSPAEFRWDAGIHFFKHLKTFHFFKNSKKFPDAF
jgi:hypothetical protein